MTTQPSRRTYAVTVFLILLVCYGYFTPKWADWGANSRADLVYAIGDLGTLSIDAYHENTGDKAFYNGHYYTDKSLGPSLVALPFYMVFKAVAAIPPIQSFINSGRGLGAFEETLNPEGEGMRSDALYQGMALTFMTFFAVSVPSALLGTVLFLFASRFTERYVYAMVLALLFGLATIAFPYSNVLYQHQFAAFGAFVGFYLLWIVVYERASLNWLWVVGVLFGLATISEYPVVPFLGIIFLWAAYKMPNRMALYRVVLGAIPLGLIFAAYNYATFQSPLPVGYEYSTNWQGVHQQGFLSLTAPSLERYAELTFGVYRGMFFISPFLLLAVPGLYLMWKHQRKHRSDVVLLALVIFGFFTYNASSVMWHGGNTVGPRYLVQMVPFLALPIIFAFNTLLGKLPGQLLVTGLGVLSIVNVWIQTIGGQAFPPEIYKNPLIEYSWPLFRDGNIARNYGIFAGLSGISSLIPLVLAAAAILILVPRVLSRREQQQSFNQVKQTAGSGD